MHFPGEVVEGVAFESVHTRGEVIRVVLTEFYPMQIEWNDACRDWYTFEDLSNEYYRWT